MGADGGALPGADRMRSRPCRRLIVPFRQLYPLSIPPRFQHARVAGAVEYRFFELVAAVVLNLCARRLLLWGAYFDDQRAAGPEMIPGAGDQPVEDGETVRAAVQRLMGLIVADA